MRAGSLLLAITLGGGIGPAIGAAAAQTAAAQEHRAMTNPPAFDPALLYAQHGSPGAFFNPWERMRASVLSLLKWQLSSNPYDKRRPAQVPRIANNGAGLAGREHSGSLTWVGHATFAVHDDDDVFLTDPHFGPRALFPKRQVAPGVPLASIPHDAFAVISHDHYDHLDAWTVDRLPSDFAFFVPLGLAKWFRGRGRDNVVELDWWQSAQHGRWTITCLPAQHWSARIEHGRNATLWCSWLLQNERRSYYFAGDTGYFPGFTEIGRRFGPIDVAMLPIGAYEPRWFMKYQHMDPQDAHRAFLDLQARFMVGMHWGTFDLTDEPLDEPPRALAEVVEREHADNQRIRVMAIGERWRVPDQERGRTY